MTLRLVKKIELSLSVQYAVESTQLPDRHQVRRWVQAACEPLDACITVRFVGRTEGRKLNRDYRGKNSPTNVLAFDYGRSGRGQMQGDLVVCFPVVEEEAFQQAMPVIAHCTRIIVHGILHLRGFDHRTDEEEAHMVEQERRILSRFLMQSAVR